MTAQCGRTWISRESRAAAIDKTDAARSSIPSRLLLGACRDLGNFDEKAAASRYGNSRRARPRWNLAGLRDDFCYGSYNLAVRWLRVAVRPPLSISHGITPGAGGYQRHLLVAAMMLIWRWFGALNPTPSSSTRAERHGVLLTIPTLPTGFMLIDHRHPG